MSELEFHVQENWSQELLLSKSAVRNARQWFCSIKIGEYDEVEISVDGNDLKPDKVFWEMADHVLKQFDQYLQKALHYLHTLIPSQEPNEYYLTGLTFGRIYNFNDSLLSGFTIEFLLGDYPDAFQYKVKFSESGWPIGYEGGPL